MRFHRRVDIEPAPGLGLGPLARDHIHAMRTFVDQFPVHASQPRMQRLADRTEDEAYLLDAGDRQAIYFTGKGDSRVRLVLPRTASLRWLEIESASLHHASTRSDLAHLQAPGPGQWVAILGTTRN